MIAISCAGIEGVEQSAYLVEKQVLCEGYDEAEAKKARQYYRLRNSRGYAPGYIELMQNWLENFKERMSMEKIL